MLQTYKPESKLLQGLVDFYYVFNRERDENISYIAFPHVNTGISFFKDVDIKRGDYEINITASNQHKSKCAVEILGKYTRPVFVNYTGNCEEVAVIFKPLGVNHFFQNDLLEIAPLFSQELKNPIWTSFSQELFNNKSISQKIELMETFLLNNLQAFDNNKLYEAINYLANYDSNYAIDQIASLCWMTLKTFQRNFKKHLTCSPSDYKRISRFRHSIQNKLISEEVKTLTLVSNESNYYDQSYFIREFKKLTHLNPKSFFNTVSALDEKKIVWKVK